MADPVIVQLDDWRQQMVACQRFLERRLLEDAVSDEEQQTLREARRSVISVQTSMLRLIERVVSVES